MRLEPKEGHARSRLYPLGSHRSHVPGEASGRLTVHRGCVLSGQGVAVMTTASITSSEMRIPLEGAFLPHRQGLEGLQGCWNGHSGHQMENAFFEMDPVAVACGLNTQQPSGPTAHVLCPDAGKDSTDAEKSQPILPLKGPGSDPEGVSLLPGFSRLSLGTSNETPPHTPVKKGAPPGPLSPSVVLGERSARPLPPLPMATAKDFLHDEMDQEVEFLTSSDTCPLLEGCKEAAFQPSTHAQRSFRGCGQINYAYTDPAGPAPEELPPGCPQPSSCVAPPLPPPPPPPSQLHRRLRRSHSGPAGSFHKPVPRAGSHLRQASPVSHDKPEVPPRAPIPPRALKPDYRRWSAEVASSAYSDEDKPPKVPPREPLSRGGSRTPSPKSLPSYLNGIMPPTQSFAPDPKYVSIKALQRQHSEGSAHRVPCILPIIENGRQVSSTHYYLLPDRPSYLDRYEKLFQEVQEAKARSEGPLLWEERDGREEKEVAAAVTAALAAPVKRKHFSCVVSP